MRTQGELAAERRPIAREPQPETKFVDLSAIDPTAPRAWFAVGALEGAPIALIVGAEKAGKSWILADLAVATVAGQSWLGRFPVVRPGPVLVLDAEYGAHEYARRVARLARGRGLDPASTLAALRYLYTVGWSIVGEDSRVVSLLRDLVRRTVEPALVIIDPLRNHLEGDENSAADVLDAWRFFAAIREQCRCPVVVAHHLNKAGTASGSRALRGRADVVIEGSDDQQPWYSTVGRTIRASDPIAQRFSVAIDHEHDDDDSRARTVLSCRFAGEGHTKAELPPLAHEVADELDRARRPLSVRRLREATRRNHRDVTQALEALEKSGRAERTKDGWRITTVAFFGDVGGDDAKP